MSTSLVPDDTDDYPSVTLPESASVASAHRLEQDMTARSSAEKGGAGDIDQPSTSARIDEGADDLTSTEGMHGVSDVQRGGRLRSRHMPVTAPGDGSIVTCIALDLDYAVVGSANTKIYIYDANTGLLFHTLIGHTGGVWVVHLVSRGGSWDGTNPPGDEPVSNSDIDTKYHHALGLDLSKEKEEMGRSEGPGKPSDSCHTSEGWGQPNPIVVSAGSDKNLCIWDVLSGDCIYVLQGHTSTVRCVGVLHNRPIAVTGSRDTTVRVWDIQKGEMLRVLKGHSKSVRCLDICGNKAVRGSYDAKCRIWNVDTGRCLHVLIGHVKEVYSVAFDGVRVVSGGMDTTIRMWDATSGQCIALFQEHSNLVCELQLCPNLGLLATGSSGGQVVTFDLRNDSPEGNVLQRISAHDSAITTLQMDSEVLITSGSNGQVRIYNPRSGVLVRDLIEPCDHVRKVASKGGTCIIACERSGNMVIEIWTLKD